MRKLFLGLMALFFVGATANAQTISHLGGISFSSGANGQDTGQPEWATLNWAGDWVDWAYEVWDDDLNTPNNDFHFGPTERYFTADLTPDGWLRVSYDDEYIMEAYVGAYYSVTEVSVDLWAYGNGTSTVIEDLQIVWLDRTTGAPTIGATTTYQAIGDLPTNEDHQSWSIVTNQGWAKYGGVHISGIIRMEGNYQYYPAPDAMTGMIWFKGVATAPVRPGYRPPGP